MCLFVFKRPLASQTNAKIPLFAAAAASGRASRAQVYFSEVDVVLETGLERVVEGVV